MAWGGRSRLQTLQAMVASGKGAQSTGASGQESPAHPRLPGRNSEMLRAHRWRRGVGSTALGEGYSCFGALEPGQLWGQVLPSLPPRPLEHFPNLPQHKVPGPHLTALPRTLTPLVWSLERGFGIPLQAMQEKKALISR